MWDGKKLPLAIIVTLAIQSFMLVFYASSWSARLEAQYADHERRIVRAEGMLDEYGRSTSELCQRLAKLEERSSATLNAVARIEDLLRGKK
jgi:hypothetical protein